MNRTLLITEEVNGIFSDDYDIMYVKFSNKVDEEGLSHVHGSPLYKLFLSDDLINGTGVFLHIKKLKEIFKKYNTLVLRYSDNMGPLSQLIKNDCHPKLFVGIADKEMPSPIFGLFSRNVDAMEIGNDKSISEIMKKYAL